MRKWLKKYIDPVCPLFGIIPLLACFALNMIVYSGTMILCRDWTHYDLTLDFDRSIPLVPGWIYIYLGCYLFWIANYVMAARINRHDKTSFYRFVATDMMSRLVCAVFYLGFPTTNIRPEFHADSLSSHLLTFVYSIDQPTNLFPSIHCLVSWLCFIVIRDSKSVKTAYKIFSCIFALLVVASTQFTKQHYILDAVAGILLAELLWFINQKISLYRLVKKPFELWNHKLQLD